MGRLIIVHHMLDDVRRVRSHHPLQKIAAFFPVKRLLGQPIQRAILEVVQVAPTHKRHPQKGRPRNQLLIKRGGQIGRHTDNLSLMIELHPRSPFEILKGFLRIFLKRKKRRSGLDLMKPLGLAKSL